VSERLDMTQGFERFVEPRQRTAEAEDAVAAWLRSRPLGRPFFLFANLMDAHPPFDVRAPHPFLPPGVSADEVRAVVRSPARFRLCESPPGERERAILRAQYLLGVSRADARLGRIVELLRSRAGDAPLVVIVTSDHGELLGEHGLVDHQFGLWEELVRVPLVVHGVPDAAPAVVDVPVALADVFPSVLGWAGIAPPRGIWGRPLPTGDAAASGEAVAPRPIVAEHVDPEGTAGGPAGQAMRAGCPSESGLFGDARVLVAWPEKLHVHEGIAPRLFALDVDPGEERDLAGQRAERVAALEKLLPAAPPAGERAVADAERAMPEGEIVERLRELGYLGSDGAGAPSPPSPHEH
jgi:arylsulfatase A-like enzyme